MAAWCGAVWKADCGRRKTHGGRQTGIVNIQMPRPFCCHDSRLCWDWPSYAMYAFPAGNKWEQPACPCRKNLHFLLFSVTGTASFPYNSSNE